MSLRCEATAVFDGDQPDVAGPFYPEGAEKLGQKFKFGEVGTAARPDGSPAWAARHGRFEEIRIVSVTGSEDLLSVEVDGGSEAARRALDAVWEHLSSRRGVAAATVATILDRTTAVVRWPVPFASMVPLSAFILESAEKFAPIEGARLAREPLFRFSLQVQASVGSRPVNRSFTIEPRATAQSNSNVLFTQSPLTDTEHMLLLQRLIERVPTVPLSVPQRRDARAERALERESVVFTNHATPSGLAVRSPIEHAHARRSYDTPPQAAVEHAGDLHDLGARELANPEMPRDAARRLDPHASLPHVDRQHSLAEILWRFTTGLMVDAWQHSPEPPRRSSSSRSPFGCVLASSSPKPRRSGFGPSRQTSFASASSRARDGTGPSGCPRVAGGEGATARAGTGGTGPSLGVAAWLASSVPRHRRLASRRAVPRRRAAA